MTAKASTPNQREDALRLISAARQFLRNPRVKATGMGFHGALSRCAQELEIDPRFATEALGLSSAVVDDEKSGIHPISRRR